MPGVGSALQWQSAPIRPGQSGPRRRMGPGALLKSQAHLHCIATPTTDTRDGAVAYVHAMVFKWPLWARIAKWRICKWTQPQCNIVNQAGRAGAAA